VNSICTSFPLKYSGNAAKYEPGVHGDRFGKQTINFIPFINVKCCLCQESTQNTFRFSLQNLSLKIIKAFN
jgi:hypothetical protein